MKIGKIFMFFSRTIGCHAVEHIDLFARVGFLPYLCTTLKKEP